MKPIILFVQDGKLSYDGANPSRLLYITTELNKIGYDTILIGKYAMKLADNHIYDLPLKSFLSRDNRFERVIQDVQTYVVAIRHILSSNIRYIYVKGSILFFLSLFARMFGKKIIFEIRDSLRFTSGYKFRKFFRSLMETVSDYIIVCSEACKLLLPVEHQEKTLVLENSVDISEFKKELKKSDIKKLMNKYNISDDVKVIGFFATGRGYHCVEDLIEVQKYLSNVVSLLACNLSRYPPRMYSVIKQKALPYSNVIIFEHVIPHDDVIMLLKYVVDICILPYDKDFIYSNIKSYMYSRKMFEYVASGKPIIFSDIKGLPIFLKENENYILYESKNPKDLAEKVKLLLEDEILYKKLSENNLKLSKEITWEQGIKKSGLLDLLDKECGEKSQINKPPQQVFSS